MALATKQSLGPVRTFLRRLDWWMQGFPFDENGEGHVVRSIRRSIETMPERFPRQARVYAFPSLKKSRRQGVTRAA